MSWLDAQSSQSWLRYLVQNNNSLSMQGWFEQSLILVNRFENVKYLPLERGHYFFLNKQIYVDLSNSVLEGRSYEQ